MRLLAIVPEYKNPCQPSPCGPNSQCREINNQAVCSCLPNYVGSPPGCRPECVVSSECSRDKACVNQKCVDPCPGVCGTNAECRVNNHSPICTCINGFTGNAFTRCYPIPEPLRKTPCVYCIEMHTNRMNSILAPVKDTPINPCIPSPCGPFSQCHEHSSGYTCSCLPNYYGSPPNCHPECTINAECPSNKACINQHCRDPCPGACGISAVCNAVNHTPMCTCLSGYVGDPFTQCRPAPPPRKIPTTPPTLQPVKYILIYVTIAQDEPKDPCNPSPCGFNAKCSNGVCSCLPEYQGDPYYGCRPECVQSSECPRDKACIRSKCVDPCPGTCASNAVCDVINHIPMCSCPPGQTGNAFISCRAVPSTRHLKLKKICRKKAYQNKNNKQLRYFYLFSLC